MLGVVAKRTFDIRPGSCEVSHAQVPLVEMPLLDAGERLLHDTDLILQRRAADVVISGNAYAPAASSRFTVAFRVGRLSREIDVVGDRRLVRRRSGELELTVARPISEVPLTWAHAYGGVDRIMLAELGDPLLELLSSTGEQFGPEHSIFAYPRNPHGRGYVIEASDAALEATLLPNLEDPRRPLSAADFIRKDPRYWPVAPLPVSTDWLSYTMFPRSVAGGMSCPLYARDVIDAATIPEIASGALKPNFVDKRRHMAERFDPVVTQSSAPAMRVAGIAPGDEIELINMHPTWNRLQFVLPGLAPRVAVRLPGQELLDLRPRIGSINIRPSEGSLSLCWVAETQIEVPLTAAQQELIEHAVVW